MQYMLTCKVNNAPTSLCSSTAHGVCSTSAQKRQATTAAVVRQPHASDDGTATHDNEQIEDGDGEDEQESQGGIQPRSWAWKFCKWTFLASQEWYQCGGTCSCHAGFNTLRLMRTFGRSTIQMISWLLKRSGTERCQFIRLSLFEMNLFESWDEGW